MHLTVGDSWSVPALWLHFATLEMYMLDFIWNYVKQQL